MVYSSAVDVTDTRGGLVELRTARSIHHGAGFVPEGGDWQAILSNFFA